MHIKPEELASAGYRLQDELPHKEILPFIRRSFEVKNSIYFFYNGLMLVFFVMMTTLLCLDLFGENKKISDEFTWFSFGVAAAFLLIPLHEYLHALAYKYVGATTTSYDMNLKRFYFMAMADRFVASSSEFRLVILTPFIVISLLCILIALFLPHPYYWLPIGTFFTHAMCCSGDFGLLSYLEQNKHKEIVTYDDKKGNISYFYSRPLS